MGPQAQPPRSLGSVLPSVEQGQTSQRVSIFIRDRARLRAEAHGTFCVLFELRSSHTLVK